MFDSLIFMTQQFFAPPQGISPARALGPAPHPVQQFAHDDSMITPHNQKLTYAPAVHSSGTSSSATTSSAATVESNDSAEPAPSEDENDSPTRGPSASRAMQKMQLNERGPAREGPTTRQPAVISRPQRPQSKVIGGRTSAKFAKVAEDPGVEGVPPGPRSMDRPGPSFACIIGQAILKSSAGGLSLEHIYRYVETAYPYFKNGDGAWRNSVRHNLSIHKMFETIPRTEKFPPGKGGIWIIHEDEKCHWPEENKFIKNFPASHPHHSVCRQTLHERAKEKDAIEKAAREGRVYVPKKGKKARKLTAKDDDSIEMVRTGSAASMDHEIDPMIMQHAGQPPNMYLQPQFTPQMAHQDLPPLHMMHAPHEDDDGEFLPMDIEHHHHHVPPGPSMEQHMAQRGIMVPPHFDKGRLDKRLAPPSEDDENVFTTGKRVRLSEPRPHSHVLAPILAQQPEFQGDWDDTFITPERERPTSSSKATSSSFRTPALVNTSSSPGSSPMPPTITRATHHPSALQQAWTHDDMADAASVASPQDPPKLDEAFDLQPKGKMRTRANRMDEDVPSILPGGVPKTPLSRSSALREAARTPATSLAKTPLFSGRSPAQAPPSVTALLSTPLWEVGGCLDRLKGYGGSPTQVGRSPVPPTSPTRYAMLLDSGTSPSARKLREFNL